MNFLVWVFRPCVCGEKLVRNVLTGKPEGKRPLRRPRPRLQDNIRMDRREIGWEGVDWVHVAQDRDRWRSLVNTVINLRVPLSTENFLTS